MSEFWEQSFKDNQKMWGEDPAEVTMEVKSLFQKNNIKSVLIPGFGYGRNAKTFINSDFSVTGIEISKTAIEIAEHSIDGSYYLHHGSITEMPFDSGVYQGIYCYALLHLLSAAERNKFINDCFNQLEVDGIMVFVTLSTEDHRFGKGEVMNKKTFLTNHGISLFFFDLDAIEKEFSDYGLYEAVEIDEPTIYTGGKPSQKFWRISCRKVTTVNK